MTEIINTSRMQVRHSITNHWASLLTANIVVHFSVDREVDPSEGVGFETVQYCWKSSKS